MVSFKQFCLHETIRVESNKASSICSKFLFESALPSSDNKNKRQHYPGRPHGPSFLSHLGSLMITQCSCVGLPEPAGSLIRHNVFIIAYIPLMNCSRRSDCSKFLFQKKAAVVLGPVHVVNCSKKEVISTNSYLYSANNLSTLIT